jgi:hypothetical protein
MYTSVHICLYGNNLHVDNEQSVCGISVVIYLVY